MNPRPSTRKPPNRSSSRKVTVPRDHALDDAAKDRAKRMPSPDTVNAPDEEYAEQDKPLLAGSPEAKALHRRTRSNRGQLGVGTAGDAARPSKPGIHNKPIPPRGRM
jgi:hypothetical protein